MRGYRAWLHDERGFIMKLTDFNDLINREITWICISASAASSGGVTLQIEQTETGTEVTLSRSGKGTGFECDEEVYSDVRISSVIERIKKINAISLVQDEEDENSFSFDDDAEIAGTEYEISFGIDEYIVFSITGCDFQSKSINLFTKVIMSMFREGGALLEFLGGDY